MMCDVCKFLLVRDWMKNECAGTMTTNHQEPSRTRQTLIDDRTNSSCFVISVSCIFFYCAVCLYNFQIKCIFEAFCRLRASSCCGCVFSSAAAREEENGMFGSAR
jgi:hypothetical protein